ncbi:acetyltransferase [Kribbella flavida DSM 17836]|uniref:Acetyltransferase n=1 Tax=Kribbella flavida (strain DSM 17836 / JCM 10339 / NBRC 14399) TaxID=479435 RepID=D2PKL3_KRIFD|nr:GNAT family N-acetyltransferase [Kribbella flavida]ADB30525.1 acetyltransferase [Kribbella flavida DSM 17836]
MTNGIGRFEGEWDELVRLLNLGFAQPWNDAQLEAERKVWEPARSFVAAEDKELTGHTTAFSLRMTVPGAQLPVAGVSMVCVSPTHTRRGILRDLMRAQLTDLHENGVEPVAVLTASEPVIYGRFGYGLGSDHQQITVPKTARALRPVAGVDAVRVRYADLEEARAVTTRIHNEQAAGRPGMFQHDDRWHDYVSGENVVTDTSGASPLRCVLATVDGEVTGYAYFRTRRTTKGFVDVSRVHARDLASHVALWQLLLNQDLLGETTYEHLPSDDPLLSLLVDPRAPKPTTADGLWVRLADVGRALAGRTYAEEVDVVLGVSDDFLPWNAGQWHLTGGPGGASCEKTDRPADVQLDVRELGAVYLGKPSLALLGAAGLVEERTEGALAATSRAFLGKRLPWLDTGF